MADPQIGAGRRGLAEKAFEVEARVGELRRGIGDEFGFFGVKRLDIGFDLGQEPSLASLHERRDARNQKRIVPRRGSVWVLDNPFGVMMLAGLGKRVLFAGDHKQLSPMVQSPSDDARRWMGRSPFGYLNLSVAVKNVLEEQSRMAPEICRTVSDLFYDGQLRVAKKEAADPEWRAHRDVNCGSLLGSSSVILISGSWEAEFLRGAARGYFCRESAEVVVAIAGRVAETVNLADIAILTPYRAQRAEISNRLQAARLPPSLVSTVHRAQGSERLVVIVDPVRPSAGFVNSEEGERLLNVAFSRAKGKLLVIVHPDYEANEKIRRLVSMFPPRMLTVDAIRPSRSPN